MSELIGKYAYAQSPDGNEFEGTITDVRFNEVMKVNDKDSGGRELPDYIEIDGIQIPPHWVLHEGT